MLRYLYADELNNFPKLRDTMFLDRADQFQDRLEWDVTVDQNGFETDAYDAENPLYVIWELPDGTHGGSMRFLPTTGKTMINDHFTDIIGGGSIVSPLIWECTRFCLKRGAPANVAAALMMAGLEVLNGVGIQHVVGVFDARMVRIYRMIGASPEILGSTGTGRDQISVGLWEFSQDAYDFVVKKSGVTAQQSRAWFDAAFGKPQEALDIPLMAIA